MALKNLFKLERLKIKAYSDRARGSADLVDTFEAMFNPESFSQTFGLSYQTRQGINTSGRAANYVLSEPASLSLKLILDGTGVNEIGIISLFRTETVSDRIKKFLELTADMNGSTHQPNFLLVEWGDLNFSCRLSTVEINYTTFDRSGKPLRAELSLSLTADETDQLRNARERKSSPDLTHYRIVKNGDTLPLLTKEIYGSAEHYLRVAQVNLLSDFRNLKPGQKILFPPFESQIL